MVIKLPKCDTWRDRRMETYSCKFAATVKLSLKTCETLNCDIYYKIGGLFLSSRVSNTLPFLLQCFVEHG